MSRTTIEVHDSLGDYMMNRVSSECDLLTRSRLAVTRVRINGGSRGDIAVASDVCWVKVRARLEGISNLRWTQCGLESDCRRRFFQSLIVKQFRMDGGSNGTTLRPCWSPFWFLIVWIPLEILKYMSRIPMSTNKHPMQSGPSFILWQAWIWNLWPSPRVLL